MIIAGQACRICRADGQRGAYATILSLSRIGLFTSTADSFPRKFELRVALKATTPSQNLPNCAVKLGF
jgi:hypothetical protein